MRRSPREDLGWVRAFIASIGAAFISLLIRLLGRRVAPREVPWLIGPTGGAYIGDRPYEEWAAREDLTLVRNAREGGLLPNMETLNSDLFDADRVHPEVRRFYEHTSQYRMDLWVESAFPANIALWLLVTSVSRRVNQLNFPLRVLDTAKGMDSEIVQLQDRAGRVRYTGWYRRQTETQRVIYTGFYMTEVAPHSQRPCVKVVFPMPRGNATVLLEPRLDPDGHFLLSSSGRAFGDAGFYRVTETAKGLWVWRVRTLREFFRVYLDSHDTLRCDHEVRFLGLPVIRLHYRIEPAPPASAP